MKKLNVQQIEKVSGGWFLSTSPSAPGSGTLGPGGGSDPGNSDLAGNLPNRQDPITGITLGVIAIGSKFNPWATTAGIIAYLMNR